MGALDRLHQHKPPSTENSEQYRDCLLWEVLCDYYEQDCILITNDNHFKDNKSKSELAELLLNETENKVKYFLSLEDFVITTKHRVPKVNKDVILTELLNSVNEILERYSLQADFKYGKLKSSQIDLFATENPDSIAVIFKLHYPAYDFSTPIESNTYDEVQLELNGSCIISYDLKNINSLSMENIKVYSTDGKILPAGIVFMSASMGRGSIPYNVRGSID